MIVNSLFSRAAFSQSLIFHFSLFGMLLLSGGDFLFWDPLPENPEVRFIKSAVRVDVVAMPKQTLKELKVLNQMSRSDIVEEEKPAEQADLSKPSDDSLEVKKSNFLDRINKLSKQKINTKKAEEKKVKKNKISNTELKKLVTEGNKISSGKALTGTGSAETLEEFELYQSSLPDQLKPFWKLPTYLINEGLNCRIRIYLSSRGELLKATVFESSGNEEYDKRALDAVKQASPFPPPPESSLVRFRRGDIILGFPL